MAITMVVCVIVWVGHTNAHHEAAPDTCKCAHPKNQMCAHRREPGTGTISGKQGTERYAPEDVRTHHGP